MSFSISALDLQSRSEIGEDSVFFSETLGSPSTSIGAFLLDVYLALIQASHAEKGFLFLEDSGMSEAGLDSGWESPPKALIVGFGECTIANWSVLLASISVSNSVI
jgi:hypothetical protein